MIEEVLSECDIVYRRIFQPKRPLIFVPQILDAGHPRHLPMLLSLRFQILPERFRFDLGTKAGGSSILILSPIVE